MTSIDSSAFKNFEVKTPTQRPSTQTKAPDISQPEDKSQKKIKKVLIGAAAAAGVAAIAFAGISMLKKGKMPDEVKDGLSGLKVDTPDIVKNMEEEVTAFSKKVSDVQKHMKDMLDSGLEEAQKTVDEVKSFFYDGAQKGYQDVVGDNGKIVRKFELDEQKATIKLIEYAEDGSVTREAKMKNPALELGRFDSLRIHDFSKKAEIDIDKYGTMTRYAEGVENLSDGGKKIAKEVGFSSKGKPHIYAEGVENLSDGGEKIAKKVEFSSEGNPHIYTEGVESKANGIYEEARRLYFDKNGNPSSYKEGVKDSSYSFD